MKRKKRGLVVLVLIVLISLLVNALDPLEQVNVEEQEISADNYACWNSEYVKFGDKVTNIDFDLSYKENTTEIITHEFKVDIRYDANIATISDVTLVWKCPDNCNKDTGPYESSGNRCWQIGIRVKWCDGGSCDHGSGCSDWCDDCCPNPTCDIGPYYGNRFVRNCNEESSHGIHKIETRDEIEFLNHDKKTIGMGYPNEGCDQVVILAGWEGGNDYFYWIEEEDQAVKLSFAPNSELVTFENPDIGDNIFDPSKNRWYSEEFEIPRYAFWPEGSPEPYGEMKIDENYGFECREKHSDSHSNWGDDCGEGYEQQDIIDKVRFFNPVTMQEEEELNYDNLPPGISKWQIMIELEEGYKPTFQETSEQLDSQLFSYSCPESKNEEEKREECIYPLPGNPPYIIENSHPHLYDLYFLNESGDETLITGVFDSKGVYGNIKAKRISKQVILSADEDNDLKFYGCNSAYDVNSAYFKSLDYCSTKANNFCSYFERKGDHNLISTWSDEELSTLGYDTSSVPEGKDPDIFKGPYDLFDKESEYINTLSTGPGDRIQQAKVFETQNIIPNPLFEDNSGDLFNWQMYGEFGEEMEGGENVEDQKITVNNNQKLVSELIAVPKNTNFRFEQELDCPGTKIELIDREGTIFDVPHAVDNDGLFPFNTLENDYVRLTFSGGNCDIKHPILQLDKGEPLEFSLQDGNFFSNSYLPDNDQYRDRAGAACCLKDNCWNGFSCVEEMSELSYMSERLSDEERNYRCIEGEWKLLPVQYDWNFKNRGFCEEDTSCLVTKSTETNAGYNSTTFYEGQIPVCISNGEYLLDHYCDEGSWTSRTKYLAQKIVDAIEELGEDEYSLYCSSPRDGKSFLNFDSKGTHQTALVTGQGNAGDEVSPAADPIESAGEPSMLGSISTDEEEFTGTVCFEELNTVKDLVSPRENTCINNVCVIKLGGKTAFATTLNKNVTEESSFFQALGFNVEEVQEVCDGPEDDFVSCEFSNLDGEDIWYNKKINAIIYAKEGIDLEVGFFENIINVIVDFWDDLFGNDLLPEEENFLENVVDLNKVYLLKSGDKTVKAVMERPRQDKELLIAEYEGFTTSICDFATVNRINVPNQESIIGSNLEQCECLNDNCLSKQTFTTTSNTLFWWPKLTGKLRVG